MIPNFCFFQLFFSYCFLSPMELSPIKGDQSQFGGAKSCSPSGMSFVACSQWLITHKAALGSLIPSLAEIWLFSSHFHKNGCDKLRCLLRRFFLQNGACQTICKALWAKAAEDIKRARDLALQLSFSQLWSSTPSLGRLQLMYHCPLNM